MRVVMSAKVIELNKMVSSLANLVFYSGILDIYSGSMQLVWL
jgi:hypothetical protein